VRIARVAASIWSTKRWLALAEAATVALLLAAVAVRGIEAERPLPPEERDTPALVEPLQLLSAGSRARFQQFDALVRDDLRGPFWKAANAVYELDGCPDLGTWLATPAGLEAEQMIAQLRRGTPEEALAALALIFQIARATEWDAGVFGGARDAERLGRLLSGWLRARGDGCADDALLHEPALHAVVLYGRAMRKSYNAPLVGREDSALERARGFMAELAGAPGGRRTAFGKALQARFARATGMLADESDPLEGFEEEARVLLPDLDGDCGG